MTAPRELSRQECIELIAAGGIGRLALCLPDGPEIYPVNFRVDGSSLVFRTTTHSRLGTFAWGVKVAFETDHQDSSTRQSWSVVVKGRAHRVDDPKEVDRLRALGREPMPWASGFRAMYIRVPFGRLTGRTIGG